MSMMKQLATAQSITAEDILAPILLNETPFMGGGGMGGGTDGRNAILVHAAAVGGAGTVVYQGHDGIDQPAEDDDGWYDIIAQVAASPLRQEILLPRWIRINIETLGTGTITSWLEGVQ